MGQHEHFEIRIHDAIDYVVGKSINVRAPRRVAPISGCTGIGISIGAGRLTVEHRAKSPTARAPTSGRRRARRLVRARRGPSERRSPFGGSDAGGGPSVASAGRPRRPNCPAGVRGVGGASSVGREGGSERAWGACRTGPRRWGAARVARPPLRSPPSPACPAGDWHTSHSTAW